MNPQAMRALQRANDVRLAKAELKKEVAKGERSFASVLDEPPDWCAKLPVFDVLQWCPRVGHKRAKRITRGVVTETLPLRHLGGHSRDELLERLGDVK